MTCVHHFDVESPEPGKTLVTGTCRHCGYTREYVAHGWDGTFSDSVLPRKSSKVKAGSRVFNQGPRGPRQ